MQTVTVLEKLYGSGSPETFEQLYSGLVSGLEVHLSFAGTTNRGWIQLQVSGEDETAALNLLDREVGLAPSSVDELKKFSVIQGKVVFPNRSNEEIYVDLGVSSPKTCDVAVSVKRLCAQLTDGKEVPLQRLVGLFCLYDNMPLEIKIVKDTTEGTRIVEADLSEAQFARFSEWVGCRFDRLIVLGSLFSDVERAVKLSKSFRDIINVESLGALEQAVVCKLGTDAVGLIPRLGRYLKYAVLVPFSPKKILETIGGTSLGQQS
jgi:hypothetical protein